MAAGVTDKLWEMTDVVRLVKEKEAAYAQVKRESKVSRDSCSRVKLAKALPRREADDFAKARTHPHLLVLEQGK